MNHCYSYTTCKDADKPLECYIAGFPMETSHHRVEGQSVGCGSGLQGVCCRPCSNGPCHITPEVPHEICGASADIVVARNFLRAVAARSDCYVHVVETAALSLKEIVLSGGALRRMNVLERPCQLFRIPQGDPHTRATAMVQAILDDLYLPDYTPMKLQQELSCAPRLAKWNGLGILPRGAKSEICADVAKCSTNLNSSPTNMLLHCLKLGISTGVYGLAPTNLLNDVILGEPETTPVPVDLGVINPDYINIMVTRYQHSIFAYLQKQLKKPGVQELARAAGARGFQLVGRTHVGQSLQFRGVHYQGIFSGHAGNNYTNEAVPAIGAIDAVLSEFNYAFPDIELICDCLNIRQTCLDGVVEKQNAALKSFVFEDREHINREILDEILESYRNHRVQVSLNLLPEHDNINTTTGVSETSLKRFLGGNRKPLVDLVASGDIKGIAGVVGCSNLVTGGHDILTVELTKELIARGILVLTAGCSSNGLKNCGLTTPKAASLASPKLRAVCESLDISPVFDFGPCLAIGRLEMMATELALALNVDIPQLPLVLSTAQWLEEQALADGTFGLALGLPPHPGPPLFITGSSLMTKILIEDMKTLTGGRIIVNSRAGESTDILEQVIMGRRRALSIQEGGYETNMD